MRGSIKTSVLVVFAVSSVALVARADEEKIALDKVPAAVRKAVKDKFPKAEIKEATKEVEDGKTTFEIGLKHNGHAIDVLLKEDGTILEVEKEIAVADLPRAVADAVKAKYPKGETKKAEEVVKGETTSYEIVVVDNGKNRELAVSADGKILDPEKAEDDKD